ncbi:MAG: hypothetical protein AAGA77_11520 [Bacteroidota bacterium]
MNKLKYIERGVEVSFDNEWKVIKLDEHRYYKRVSGMGISGVDFMAVHPQFGLVLIELKNYEKGRESISSKLDTKMIAKKEDTLRLIDVVYKYYRRQFYFRLLTFIGWKYLYPKEWEIWLIAKRHMDSGNYFFLGTIDF